MPSPPLPRAADGFYHPGNEADVIALVNYARANGLQVRARGATHSVAFSIYTDPVDANPADNKTLEQGPPAGPNIDLALDGMIALTWIDENAGIVEVGAGCHLGRDPSDPFGNSTIENSFLHQAYEKGWAVNIVGGITHQTVSGFTAMGSAGGSIMYAYDNILAFRVVDGLGQASWIEADDPIFGAMLTSLGLLGVITAMRFQLIPMYNIVGTENTTPTALRACPIDLFGPGSPDGSANAAKPSLQQFLTDTPYSRITWWPQKGCERVQIWEASRAPASDSNLVPYQEFTTDLIGQAKQLAASTIYALIGNTSLSSILALLATNIGQFHRNLVGMWGKGVGRMGAAGVAAVLGGLVLLIGAILGAVKGSMRALFPHILPLFAPLSKPGKPTCFHDWYWRSLCMDNTADDVLLGTEFIEIWVPIQHTQRVMTLFQGMFDAKGSAAIGYYAQEIYAAAPTTAWMNPSWSDGADDYKDGVSRFDVYWYREDAGVPNLKHAFYEQYWDLLVKNDVPFRFHWGKFIPFYDFPKWAAYYQANLPKMADFLALRAQRDPDNVFFTTYWQLRLLGEAAKAPT